MTNQAYIDNPVGRRKRKLDAVLAKLAPGVTGDRLRSLTDGQWDELARRARVGRCSPILRDLIIAKVEERNDA